MRWGLNVSNMYVVMGDKGDTDNEELIPGAHKTIILKGIIEKGSEELLRSTSSYHKEDVVPTESPLIVHITSKEIKSEEILSAVREASKAY